MFLQPWPGILITDNVMWFLQRRPTLFLSLIGCRDNTKSSDSMDCFSEWSSHWLTGHGNYWARCLCHNDLSSPPWHLPMLKLLYFNLAAARSPPVPGLNTRMFPHLAPCISTYVPITNYSVLHWTGYSRSVSALDSTVPQNMFPSPSTHLLLGFMDFVLHATLLRICSHLIPDHSLLRVGSE